MALAIIEEFLLFLTCKAVIARTTDFVEDGVYLCLLTLAALVMVEPLVMTYLETGLVPRLPTAVLATGLGLLSSLSLTCGLILENVTHTRQEARRLIYLGIPCSGLPGTVGASVGSQD